MLDKQVHDFTCQGCAKDLRLADHIYKKAYGGHEFCLSCRKAESTEPSGMLDKAKVLEWLNNLKGTIYVHDISNAIALGRFDAPLTQEEVRQLREERDEALRIASELSTSLEWHRRILSEIKGQGDDSK